MMTLKELKYRLSALPAELDACEVKVWLPGSRISLSGVPSRHDLDMAGKNKIAPIVILEGNLDEGSNLLTF